LIPALIVAAAVIVSGLQIAAAIRASRAGLVRDRAAQLLAIFVPALGAAAIDPRALLVWHPVAQTARRLFSEEFAEIDRAAGEMFPFSRKQIEAAHAQWTADWLAWELAHDTAYKLKAAEAEHELATSANSAVARARLDAIEREKLDLYQRRYQEYIRVAKGLQALIGT
jgi:hypothetical protein